MYSPNLESFLKLAAKGNLIPVTRRVLGDFETPLSAYQKIRGQGESFLFESVEGGEHLGRYSFVGCNPRAIIRQTDNRVELIENGKVVENFIISHAPKPEPAPHDMPDAIPDARTLLKEFGKVDLKQYGQVEEMTVSYTVPPDG